MRRSVLIAVAGLLAACGGTKAPAPPAAPPPPPPAPAPINMADLAGTWNMQTVAQGTDSVLVNYTMAATADTAGWMIMLPNRKPMSVTVVASGDSIMVDRPAYESVLRKGVQVTTHSVARLVNGQMVGTVVAHYMTKTADSVVTMGLKGTKKAP